MLKVSAVPRCPSGRENRVDFIHRVWCWSEAAKLKFIYTIALTGASGGAMKQLADCALCAPSDETPRVQECHILMGHIICEIAEVALFEESREDSSATNAHSRSRDMVRETK